jgi:hypothetical protein
MSSVSTLGRILLGCTLALTLPVSASVAATRANSAVPTVSYSGSEAGVGASSTAFAAGPFVVFAVAMFVAYEAWIKDSHHHNGPPVSRG